jgi:hypothetical protein
MNETTRNTMIAKSVTMPSEHWAMLERVNSEFGLGNTSSAMRYLINSHERLQKENQRLQLANARLKATVIQLAKDAGIDTLADLEQVSVQDLLSPTF